MNNWFFKKQKIAAFLAACGSDATNDRMGLFGTKELFILMRLRSEEPLD